MDRTSVPWAARAVCRGRADLFFAPHAERPPARQRREAEACRLCATCPVLAECRDHARRHRELGLWGGETESTRLAAGYPPRFAESMPDRAGSGVA